MKNQKKLYYQNGRSNRRLQAKGFVFPPRVSATLTLIGVVLVAYIGLHNTTEAIGRKIAVVQQERGLLAEDIRNQTALWNETTSPQNLEEAMSRHRIQMVHAHGAQAVTVRNPDVWLDRRPASTKETPSSTASTRIREGSLR
jgi:hypothetical protein